MDFTEALDKAGSEFKRINNWKSWDYEELELWNTMGSGYASERPVRSGYAYDYPVSPVELITEKSASSARKSRRNITAPMKQWLSRIPATFGGFKECYICKQAGKMLINHHLSYKRNETIAVCLSCHIKIHRSREPAFRVFAPEDTAREAQQQRQHERAERRLLRAQQTKYERSLRQSLRYYGGPFDTPPIEPSIWTVCARCGTQFEGRNRTTCPKCREFFR
jgi:rubrerythrin